MPFEYRFNVRTQQWEIIGTNSSTSQWETYTPQFSTFYNEIFISHLNEHIIYKEVTVQEQKPRTKLEQEIYELETMGFRD